MRISCVGLFKIKFILSKCQNAKYAESTQASYMKKWLPGNNIYLDWWSNKGLSPYFNPSWPIKTPEVMPTHVDRYHMYWDTVLQQIFTVIKMDKK